MPDNLNKTGSLPIRLRLRVRPILNAAGTVTMLGPSIMVPEAIRAMSEIATEFVEMEDLQRSASRTIARLPGAAA